MKHLSHPLKKASAAVFENLNKQVHKERHERFCYQGVQGQNVSEWLKFVKKWFKAQKKFLLLGISEFLDIETSVFERHFDLLKAKKP